MNIFSKALLATFLALPLFAQEYPPCGPEHPAETPFGAETCTEYRTDEALILAVKFGDRQALARLKHRYDTAFTFAERHHIASSLLRHVSDDSEYWNDLYEHAENAVRFAKKRGVPNPELEAWCAARGFDPVEYTKLAWYALMWVAEDCRSHELLIRALDSEDWGIASLAILGLGQQHDEASLPLIEQTIQRLSDDRSSLVSSLAAFYSDAADTIAMRYLLPSLVEEYKQSRDETGPFVYCLSGHTPRHLLDHPTCTDVEWSSVLIAAAERGERAAIKPLMERYETSTTLVERHRIATALLRRVDDDSVYWNDLFAHAESAVDFLGTGLIADDYAQVASSAFCSVRSDPRSRALLIHALDDSSDEYIVYQAIVGLGQQHDESSLPIVEKALQRFPNTSIALALKTFHGGAADAVARRNLDALMYEVYEEWRDEDHRNAAQ